MRFRKNLFLLVITMVVVLQSFQLPKNIQKKVDKNIKSTFEIETFFLKPVKVSAEINEQLQAKITDDNLYRIIYDDAIIGFGFIDKASSKTDQFDYLVLFDDQLKVVHSAILVYREDYGGEIGSKRWLKQFLGLSGEDRVSLKKNVDGISGATISVRSMTRAIDDLLQTIGTLQKNKML